MIRKLQNSLSLFLSSFLQRSTTHHTGSEGWGVCVWSRVVRTESGGGSLIRQTSGPRRVWGSVLECGQVYCSRARTGSLGEVLVLP